MHHFNESEIVRMTHIDDDDSLTTLITLHAPITANITYTQKCHLTL